MIYLQWPWNISKSTLSPRSQKLPHFSVLNSSTPSQASHLTRVRISRIFHQYFSHFFPAPFHDFFFKQNNYNIHLFCSAPTKRRSQSGSTSVLGNGLDSPCSSRASVAGSCVSEPWSTASTAGTVDPSDVEGPSFGVQPPQPPQSNMVLRKRIRRIRQGMKRYNDQLVEVKRELKSCKTKMETQTKQVQEYSQRLEDYDKKFEESSRKFQTLLTVRAKTLCWPFGM